MATFRKAITQRNAELDGGKSSWDNGYLRIYSGTIPTHPEDAVNGTLLAELRFGATGMQAASAGAQSANAITADSSADQTGTAQSFRALRSDGTTPICDGDVSTTGAVLNLNSVSIQSGAQVSVSSFQVTNPE